MVKHESHTRQRSASSARQVGVVLHGGAEAGRAHHRAVAAGQAPARRRRPSGGARRCRRAGRGCRWCRAAGPCAATAPRHLLGGVQVRLRRRRPPAAGPGAPAPRSLPAATRNRCAAVEQFGQREVVARLRPGTGAHRDAEARAARVRAGHGDEECVLAPRRVAGVPVRPVPQHPVVDRERVQVARPDAEDGVRRVAKVTVRSALSGVDAEPVRRMLPAQMSSRGGNSTDFQPTASAAYPNSASSSRRRNR